MDDPNALELAAEQLQKVAHTFQKTVDMLQHNTLKLSQAASHLVGSGGNLGSWSGRGATAFLGAWNQIHHTSNKCMSGHDQAISCCQNAARRIEDELPTIRNGWSASHLADSGRINEAILKAIEEGNKAQSDLTSFIETKTQVLKLATTALGKCDGQEQGDGSSDGEDSVLQTFADIAKDDLKDAVKEFGIERLKEYIKEEQKKIAQSQAGLSSSL